MGGAHDFDVRELLVKPGEHVEAGARLAVLDDARFLHLRAEAAGGDAARLIAALTGSSTVEARPLVEGTGPALKGLSIHFARNDEADNGKKALEASRIGVPDIAFVDWEMPVMNGLTYLQELRKLPGGDKAVVIFLYR